MLQQQSWDKFSSSNNAEIYRAIYVLLPWQYQQDILREHSI